MKRLTPLFFIALLTWSCADDVKELSRVTRSFTLSEEFTVDISETDPTSVSESKTFDASIATQGFSSNIDKITVKSLTIAIKGYQSSAGIVSLTDASITFEGTGVSLALPTPIDLAAASDSEKIEVTIPAGSVEAVGTKLLADKSVTALIQGTITDTPVFFRAEIELEIEVTGTLL